MKLEIPEYVSILMKELNKHGYECFVVGGAIRSILLNKPVNDYDLTTSALPEETKHVFHAYHTIDTGLKHGTVTVVSKHIPVEITTYRKDAEYKDHRHPDEVIFTRTIKEDCARRDFTINALCYCEETGILDFFNGKEDIERKIVRCIGDPYQRFEEDALRILRAIRFASQLNFLIDDHTSEAILDTKETLSYVSIERIQEEMNKFFAGEGCVPLLYPYRKVFSVFLKEMDSVNWEQLIQRLQNSKQDYRIRFALVLSDPAFSDVKHTLKYMKYSNKEITAISQMIKFKNAPISTKTDILYLLKDMSCDFMQYLNYREAYDLTSYDHALHIYQSIIQNNDCYSLKQLQINGKDMIALGYTGKDISLYLNQLLDAVIEEKVINNKEKLIAYLQTIN